MSLTKLLLGPLRLFKKDVITFLIIRRHDLGVVNSDRLRYIAMKPDASLSTLRRKVWHLLDLPDYCDELIVLKNCNEVEIPLLDLRKGNDPQHPYILEVWLPDKLEASTCCYTNTINTMLTMGESDNKSSQEYSSNEKMQLECREHIQSNDTMHMNKLQPLENKKMKNLFDADSNKSDVSCRISNTSMFFKVQGRKSRDNFANVLLKIQCDLSKLNSKLSILENKIST